MLNQLRQMGPQPAIRYARQQYEAYRALDNQPSDKDPRPDFVQLSSSLGTSQIALEPLSRGRYGEIYGYTLRSESSLEPGKVTLTTVGHRSATDGTFRASEAVLEYGRVRASSLEQKQEIITYNPLRYTDSFVESALAPDAALNLYHRLEAEAIG